MLHVSLGSKSGWRWSAAFPIDIVGVHHVQIPFEQQESASLFVKVEQNGGCQKLVCQCFSSLIVNTFISFDTSL